MLSQKLLPIDWQLVMPGLCSSHCNPLEPEFLLVPSRAPERTGSHLNAQGNTCTPGMMVSRHLASRSIPSIPGCGWKEESTNDPTEVHQGGGRGEERRLQHKGTCYSIQDFFLKNKLSSVVRSRSTHSDHKEYPKPCCIMDNWGRQTITAETRVKPSNPELLC